MSNLSDESEDFYIGFMFNKRYRVVEELRPGGQSRVFVVEDITSSNKKYLLNLTMENLSFFC